VKTEGTWVSTAAVDQPFGKVWTAGPGAKLSFVFHGDALSVTHACAVEPCSGALKVTVDDQPPMTIRTNDPNSRLHVAAAGSGPKRSAHQAVIEVAEAPAGIAAISVQRVKPTWPWWVLGGTAAAVFLLLLARGIARMRRK
jgi:hypothetical protein